MRAILALCAMTLVIGGYFIWRAMQLPSEFGEFAGVPEVQVADILDRPTEFLGKPIAVRGIVRQQCKTMGCFFFFPSAKGNLRVELKDIAMDAPSREGRPARVEGQVVSYVDGYQLYASAVKFE
jgi:hypothetical protein